MLITAGFGWVAWFNAWWFMLPVALCILFIILGIRWQTKTEKKRKLRDDEIGPWGVAGVVVTVATGMLGLFYGLDGIGPHYNKIESDIESQFNLTHVNHVWIDESEKFAYTAKDPEGKFVICNTEETEFEHARKLTCDSGKDYWKGLP